MILLFDIDIIRVFLRIFIINSVIYTTWRFYIIRKKGKSAHFPGKTL